MDDITVRSIVQREVEQVIDEHCPRLWRARARLYIPLAVDKITAIIDLFRKDVQV